MRVESALELGAMVPVLLAYLSRASATGQHMKNEAGPSGLTRELIVRLHNEPLAGALALGGLCRCPVCQPELHMVDEGGEG